MSQFSERYGYQRANPDFQRESVDRQLRTDLWNVLNIAVWRHWEESDYAGRTDKTRRIDELIAKIWIAHLRLDYDALSPFRPHSEFGSYLSLKNRFMVCQWYAVYDFLEFLVQNLDEIFNPRQLTVRVNQVLEKQNTAYRFVERNIMEITDDTEIRAIEEAISLPDSPIRGHLQRALELLSDRKAPDYRNSIKESISAVEAACRLVTGKHKATLADALKCLPNLHPALDKSLQSLYGFTSDEYGIRHSLLDESSLTYADAKFMLVSCSAFASYLRYPRST